MDMLTVVAIVIIVLLCVAILVQANRTRLFGGPRTVGDEDWCNSEPPEPGNYILCVDGETTTGELRVVDHDGPDAICEWYIVGQALPVNGRDIDGWIGPMELPRMK